MMRFIMIQNSFILLEGVGRDKEQSIWQQNIAHWDDFTNRRFVKGISPMRKGFYDLQLKRAKKELYEFNSNYFTKVLPRVESWRLYNFFKEDAVFLDIETDYHGNITVIGLSDGNDMRTMVQGINLDKQLLQKELSKAKLLVTFNGSSFDVPRINHYFNKVVPDIPHVDLRHVCARLGLKGGLKIVEEKLGINRPEHLKALRGDHAIELWRAWKASGEREWLDLLVQYNEEDVLNLKPLAEFVCNGLKNQLLKIEKIKKGKGNL
jgi:uncharacterized protein